MKILRLLVLLAFSAAAWAQAPADGAIKGGTIMPGEKSGMPDKGPAKKAEQEMLGLYRNGAELARLVSGEEQNATRSFSVAFEHPF